MKKLLVFCLVFIFFAGGVISQKPPDKLTDYALYKEKTKYLIHDFKIYEGSNVIEKGSIYRYFEKNGLFETMNIVGSEIGVVYCSQPTGMINADLKNKEVYVYSKQNDKVLFLFVMRAVAKALTAETKEMKFHGITIKLTKTISKAETDRKYTTYRVSTSPQIVNGTVSCLNDLLIVNLDLDIFVRNARSHDFEDIFLLPDNFQYDKIKLQYKTDSYNYPSKKNFYKKKDIDNLLKNDDFEIINN